MAVILEQLLQFKTAVVVVSIASFFIAEQLWPQAPLIAPLAQIKQQVLRWLKNYALFGLNIALAPLIVIPLTIWATSNAWLWREHLWGESATWSTMFWLSIVVDVIILDLMIYWWHRLNHELTFLWRFHQVHHLDEFLDTSSALRFHFGEVILSALFRMLAILALGIPLPSVIVAETLLLAFTLFHHSNWRLTPKLEQHLGCLVITPALHWVHHHALQKDTDSNYGNILSLWDRLFRSKSDTQRHNTMKIGVEGRKDLPLHKLLLMPLIKPKPRPKAK